ncbi:hypothetical protein AXF42_Ash003257 [Apostasia shenzhenica]|uniref:Uncharacterized protein n=1 Tax=Apostasia shenzhenica TaxID=1088818 RepID=A0A2I0BFQ6_9ASPA|nr:hypothetical protein AXF42_Ash003257 [Apostasia shenzhenica]
MRVFLKYRVQLDKAFSEGLFKKAFLNGVLDDVFSQFKRSQSRGTLQEEDDNDDIIIQQGIKSRGLQSRRPSRPPPSGGGGQHN